MKIYQPPISAKLRESAKTVALCGFMNFFGKGAVAGKNFKNVDKYWGIWYSVLYGMLEIRWD